MKLKFQSNTILNEKKYEKKPIKKTKSIRLTYQISDSGHEMETICYPGHETWIIT